MLSLLLLPMVVMIMATMMLPAGFVLGKPSWAVPTVTLDPTGGLVHSGSASAAAAAGKKKKKAAAAAGSKTGGMQADDDDDGGVDFPPDPADQVLLSEGLGHKLVAIPDNFFMYQLEYKRVRQGRGEENRV